MYIQLITNLILSVTFMFGDYDYCGILDGKHHITIHNDVITENYIQICNDAGDIKFTILHELGHQYWHIYLSIDERNKYRGLQTENISDYYRIYSMTSAHEDFADIFALIMLQRPIERTDVFQDKVQFITQKIESH